MSCLRSQLDRIARNSGQPRPHPGPHPGVASAIEAVQRRLDGGSVSTHGGAHGQNGWRAPSGPAPRQEAVAGKADTINPAELARLKGALQQVREQLGDVNQRLATPRNTPSAQSHSTDPMHSHGQSHAQSQAIAGLAGEIARMRDQGSVTTSVLEQIAGELLALRKDYQALAGRPSATIDTGELVRSIASGYGEVARRLEGAMDQMRAAPSAQNQQTESRIAALAEHIGAIRDSIESLPVRFPIAAVHDQLEQLTHALDHLIDKGDDKLATHFSDLNERLDEVTRALVTLSVHPGANDAMDRIEARIASLTKSVENLAANAPMPADSGYAAAFADEVRGALAAMNAQLGELQHVDNSEAFRHFDARLADIGEKLDHLPAAQAGDGTTVADSSHAIGRLEAIAERLAGLQSPEIGPDWLARSEALESRFAELADRLDQSLAAAPAVSQGDAGISNSLNALTESVNRAVARRQNDGDADLLDRIHDDIAAISRKIATLGEGGGDLGPLASRLDAIEHQVALSRDIAIDVAGQAAERAVSLLGATHGGEESDAPTGQTVEVLRGMLASMADRLGEIEQSLSGHPHQPAHQPAHGPVHGNAADGAEEHRHFEPPAEEAAPIGNSTPAGSDLDKDMLEYLSQAEEDPGLPEIGNAPRLDQPEFDELAMGEAGAAQFEPSQLPGSDFVENEIAIDDLPLEPGSGAPDLAALVQRASENRQAGRAGTPVAAADVIAAARRAARSASLESAAMREKIAAGEQASRPAAGPPRRLSSIVGLLARKRKLFLTTALAAALIAVSMPVALRYFAPADEAGEARTAGGQIDATQEDQINAGSEQLAAQGGLKADLQAASENQDAIAGAEVESKAGAASSRTIGSGSELATAKTGEEMQAQAAAAAGGQAETGAMGSQQLGSAKIEASANNDSGQAERKQPEPGQSITHAPMPPQEIGNIALREAAAAGDGAALFEVARRYTDGDSVERDLPRRPNGTSMRHVPDLPRRNTGSAISTKRAMASRCDLAKAATWYEAAAKNGNALAMHNLGVL